MHLDLKVTHHHRLKKNTDTPVSDPTETLVMTTAQIPFVSPQLNETQTIALPILQANPTPSAIDTVSHITTKPEVETSSQMDSTGPFRLDPGLSSATLPVGISSASIPLMQQELAPTQASAFVPQSGSTALQTFPAGEVGPNSTVAISRDYASTANLFQPIYAPIEIQSLYSGSGIQSSVAISDSMEIQFTETRDTTYFYLRFVG